MSKKITKKAQVAVSAVEEPILVQLRLAPKLAERLRQEGAPSRRKLPAQIIHRLEQGATAGIDFNTRAMMDHLKQLSWRLGVDGEWSEDRFLYEAFKAGVIEALSFYQPHGEPVTIQGKHFVYGEGDDPAAAGRIVARQIIHEWRQQNSEEDE